LLIAVTEFPTKGRVGASPPQKPACTALYKTLFINEIITLFTVHFYCSLYILNKKIPGFRVGWSKPNRGKSSMVKIELFPSENKLISCQNVNQRARPRVARSWACGLWADIKRGRKAGMLFMTQLNLLHAACHSDEVISLSPIIIRKKNNVSKYLYYNIKNEFFWKCKESNAR
jgi:hypothetical protein